MIGRVKAVDFFEQFGEDKADESIRLYSKRCKYVNPFKECEIFRYWGIFRSRRYHSKLRRKVKFEDRNHEVRSNSRSDCEKKNRALFGHNLDSLEYNAWKV